MRVACAARRDGSGREAFNAQDASPYRRKEQVKAASIFRLLADETRLRILLLLEGDEWNVGALQERAGIPQPSVSHHLQLLRRGGLVSARRDGRFVYYKVGGNARSLGKGAVEIDTPGVKACIVAILDFPSCYVSRGDAEQVSSDS